MLDTGTDILARIVARKRDEFAQTSVPRSVLEQRAAEAQSTRRRFRAALSRRSPAIIAEIKQASPSKGVLRQHFDPVAIACEYERGGAAAISVLTDETFFGGSLTHLTAARNAVSLPVLRKDFTLNEHHILEAAATGADAVLLIAAVLEASQLRALRELAEQFGMAVLVEVHDQRELGVALASGADMIGINNRNLKTFEVTLETSLSLAEQIPDGILKISESGIQSHQDVRRLRDVGFHAFLVGEHLISSQNPAEAVRALIGES